jgi:hypothetical protein
MLQGLGALPAIAAALIVSTDRHIVRELRVSEATAASKATTLRPRPLRSIRLRRLTNVGAIHRESDGRYWLDERGWAHFRQIRRLRALTAVGVLLAAYGIAYWSGLV